MTNLFGLDATSEVSPVAQQAVGSKFIVRYLSRSSWKVVTRKEYDDYDRSGILLGLVFEDTANRALDGYEAGKADAEWCIRQSTDILGRAVNPVAMIPAAVDYDTAGNAAATDPYFDGWRAVISPVSCGPYGGFEVIHRQADRGFKGLYQTYAWSGGRIDHRTKVYQNNINQMVGGVGVDFDRAFDLTAFWNYREYRADPHGYRKLDTTERHLGTPPRAMNECATVESYDHLRALQRRHVHPHRKELAVLRQDCLELAQRIREVVREDKNPGAWMINHRHFRFTELLKRSRGQRVV